MGQRTTLILDEETKRAARQLAVRNRCSMSEAIRRAVIDQRDELLGPRASRRKARRRDLERLFGLFEGNDAAAEVRRLKREDEGF